MKDKEIVLKFKIEEKYKGFVIVNEKLLEEPLTKLRAKVDCDISDLIKKGYRFCVDDTPIGTNQEETLKTKYISRRLESPFMGMHAYEVVLIIYQREVCRSNVEDVLTEELFSTTPFDSPLASSSFRMTDDSSPRIPHSLSTEINTPAEITNAFTVLGKRSASESGDRKSKAKVKRTLNNFFPKQVTKK